MPLNALEERLRARTPDAKLHLCSVVKPGSMLERACYIFPGISACVKHGTFYMPVDSK